MVQILFNAQTNVYYVLTNKFEKFLKYFTLAIAQSKWLSYICSIENER